MAEGYGTSEQPIYGISGNQKPLIFFYDCEATGWNLRDDVIIEVAAVLYTKDLRDPTPLEFSSLCRTSKELHPEVQELTGLTMADLRNEPKVSDVLESLFDWMKETVKNVSRKERRDCIPVLAAHSGHKLDFPMLKKAVFKKPGKRNQHLIRKFQDLNLHYADTFSVFKQSGVAEKHKLEKLGVKNIYETFFGSPLEGHRARADAVALRRIFSEAPPADELMDILRCYIQSDKGTEIARKQIRQFRSANIAVPKAMELLQKGIKYEDLQRESQKPGGSFSQFLNDKCSMDDPDGELQKHFSELSLN
jgi:DNA polymerase III epsilon subunit-like protein